MGAHSHIANGRIRKTCTQKGPRSSFAEVWINIFYIPKPRQGFQKVARGKRVSERHPG